MGFYEFAELEKEIKRCIKLYPNFKEAEPFITEIYRSAGNYLKKYKAEPIVFFDAQEAETKIRQHESLELNPPLETKGIAGLLIVLADAIKKANPEMKGLVKEINDRIAAFEKDSPPEIGKEDIIDFRDSLEKEGLLDKDMATLLFSFLLHSFYRQQLDSIVEVIRTDLWEGGDCPTCGEKPHYGLLTSEEGKKLLECWLCGTRWIHYRVNCPFCDNKDHEKLGYFTVEDSEVCRVCYCQSCCQYYKLFDTRKFQADDSVVLPIHNLASLSHDLLARKEGFIPGSGLEWITESDLCDRQD